MKRHNDNLEGVLARQTGHNLHPGLRIERTWKNRPSRNCTNASSKDTPNIWHCRPDFSLLLLIWQQRKIRSLLQAGRFIGGPPASALGASFSDASEDARLQVCPNTPAQSGSESLDSRRQLNTPCWSTWIQRLRNDQAPQPPGACMHCAWQEPVQKIRSGHFDPNASRSGMMITEVKQEEVVIEDDAGFELVSDNQVALDEEAGAEPGSGSDTSSSDGHFAGTCRAHSLDDSCILLIRPCLT